MTLPSPISASPVAGAVASALRTLRLERAGIAALETALSGPYTRLGDDFAAAMSGDG